MKNSRFLRCCLIVMSAALLMIPGAYAQTRGGGSGGGGGAGSAGGGGSVGGSAGGSVGRGSVPAPVPSTDSGIPSTLDMQRPVFLQGKVVFENGQAVPANVVIERVCSGRVIPEDYTDTRGQFSFEVGRNTQVLGDASTSTVGGQTMGRDLNSVGRNSNATFGVPNQGGITERELMGCELRASLAGYTSTVIPLSGHRLLDNPEVGTIILRKLGDAAGLTISMTSLEAPKKAKKALEDGTKQMERQKWDKAQAAFESAVKEYPEYAEAWYGLGNSFRAQQHNDQAREAYEKAIAADGKYMSPHVQLAIMAAQQNQWQDVANKTDLVIGKNPYDFPQAYFLNAVAQLNLGNAGAAEKSAREAVKMEYWRQQPQVEYFLGVALGMQNNLTEASVHLKRYLELAPDAPNAPQARQQLIQVEQVMAASQGTTPAALGQGPQ